MRYMFLVISGPETTAAPPQRLMEEMNKLIEKRTADGSLIDTGGLLPTGLGAARVALKQGKLSVTDGPFAESKEVIGGYAIFELATREEALAAAIEFMELHRLHMPGWDGVCEMRPMFGAEDPSCGSGADTRAA